MLSEDTREFLSDLRSRASALRTDGREMTAQGMEGAARMIVELSEQIDEYHLSLSWLEWVMRDWPVPSKPYAVHYSNRERAWLVVRDDPEAVVSSDERFERAVAYAAYAALGMLTRGISDEVRAYPDSELGIRLMFVLPNVATQPRVYELVCEATRRLRNVPVVSRDANG